MNKKNIKNIMCSTVSGVISLTSAANMEAANNTPLDTTPIKDITFVVFDTETSGWKEHGRVIEIGAVKFQAGKEIAKKSWLINPGSRITPDSQRIHGISDAMVANAPSFKEVLPKFTAFSRDSVLLAHNAGFDVRFMKGEIERNNLEAPANTVLDTLRLSRKWFPQFKSHSLSNLITFLNISAGTLHRALADSECTKEMFVKGLNTMPEDATYGDLTKLAGKPLYFKTEEAE